jgi:VWFA-related protein
MRPNRERVIASAVEFVKHSHPKDEIFVLTFNEQVRPAWAPSVTGATDPGRFASAMSRAIVARGMTAIYDAILAGLQRVAGATHSRQVLIAVSDGDDNASTANRDEVLKQVHESDATVYTIALIDPLTREGNPKLLRRLARATGGESYEPRRAEAIGEAFDEIARDIRSAYTLAYAPTSATAGTHDDERRRRTVRVYVRSKDGRALRVRTRDGYFEDRGRATP